MTQENARFELREELGAKLEAYRLGAMGPEEQKAFEAELLARPELARALYESEGLDAALRVGMQPHRRVRRIPRRLLIPLAAAALVLVAILPRLTTKDTTGPAPIFRGSETELSALAPIGEASGTIIVFRWTDYENAEAFRLEIFDTNSHKVLEREVETDNTEVDAQELTALKEARGFWRVTALGELDEELATSSPAPLHLR